MKTKIYTIIGIESKFYIVPVDFAKKSKEFFKMIYEKSYTTYEKAMIEARKKGLPLIRMK